MKKKGQIAEAGVVEGVSDTYVLTTFIHNMATDKDWTLDSDSAVHVYSRKMFNSLVANKAGTVKMVQTRKGLSKW